jgi:hypothetical protein
MARSTESAQLGVVLWPEEHRVVDIDLYMVMLKVSSVDRETWV